MPISRQVRRTRTAISPRFATRIFWIGRRWVIWLGARRKARQNTEWGGRGPRTRRDAARHPAPLPDPIAPREAVLPGHMRILVADAFPKERLDDFRALGLEVDHQPTVSVADLPAAAREARILVVRGKQVTGEVFAGAPALSLVVRAGAGVNTIDVGAASRRGVYVANCPGQNSIAVAELAIGLLVALDRRIPDNVALLRAGKWDKKSFSEAEGALRPDPGHRRRGRNRARGGAARPGARHEGRGLVAIAGRGRGEAARRGAGRRPGRAGAPVGRALRPPAALEGDARRDLPGRARGAPPRRHLPQHGPGGGGGPGGAAGAGARGPHPGGHRRLQPASRRRGRPSSRASWASCPTSTAPTTSGPRPPRRRTPSRGRRCASSRRSCGPGAFRAA